MTRPSILKQKIPGGVILLMLVQIACVVYFIGDVFTDHNALTPNTPFELHFSVETFATLSLVAGIVFEGYYLLELLRRKAHLEQSLSTANAAVYDVIKAHFEEWKLSPSETDVANLLVKGLEISAIAEVRGCAEGTVKAHLNAIYRKSGTHSRGELLSVIIDTLLDYTSDR